MEKVGKSGKGMRAILGLMAGALIAALMACGRSGEMEEGGETPYVIKDWEVNTDTLKTQPDSVREATHEDSVRFGLI